MIQQITSGDFSDDYIAYQKLSDKTERIIVTKQFDLKKDGVYWNDVIREFDRMSYSKHPNFLEPYSVFKMIYYRLSDLGFSLVEHIVDKYTRESFILKK